VFNTFIEDNLLYSKKEKIITTSYIDKEHEKKGS